MINLNFLLEQMKRLDYDAKKQLYEAVRQELINEEIVEILREYRDRITENGKRDT